ncbi:chlorite dismutase family protein [Burkholderia sp. 3C]
MHPTGRLVSFVGSDAGTWRVAAMQAVAGDALPAITALMALDGSVASSDLPSSAAWSLRGVTSNERYTSRDEKAALVASQPGLGRDAATYAALIPIRKRVDWWLLTQEERREILETRSRHIQIGLEYLPAIARKLYHCRDLSEQEPFDFLTWFEFAPAERARFDDLLAALRETEEWKYVDRETEIRLERAPSR